MGSKRELNEGVRRSIIELKKAGLSHNAITAQLGISKSAVSKILSRHARVGHTRVKPRSGRPAKFTRHVKLLMRRSINSDPHQTANDLKRNVPDLQEVHVSSVKRVLNDIGYQARKPRRMPMMTKAHLRKRLQFCHRTKDWTVQQWSEVMWSDESIFLLFQSPNSFVRRPPNSDPTDPKFTVPCVKHPGSLMVWACMCFNGRGGLYFLPCNSKMNSQTYIGVLDSHLLPFMSIRNTKIFMQDGAPCHTAKATKEWLRQHNIQVLEWPPNSPDLNPIENLWSIMKAKVAAMKIKSTAELRQVLTRVWCTDIDDELCKKTCKFNAGASEVSVKKPRLSL